MQAIISLFVSFTLVFSLTSSVAFAEVSSGIAQSSTQVEAQAGGGQLATGSSNLFAQDAVEEPHDIGVTVGLPSESNVKKDLYVNLSAR